MTLATRTTTTNTKTGNAKSVKNEEWKNSESEKTVSVLVGRVLPNTPATSTATMDEDEIEKPVSMAIVLFAPELIIEQHDSILQRERKICPAA